MNIHGYAIAIFRNDFGGNLEILRFKESDRVSSVEIGKFLEEYDEIRTTNRIGYDTPQEYVYSNIFTVVVNRKDKSSRGLQFGRRQPHCMEISEELVDLSIAVNDKKLTFSPDVDRLARKKIGELESEDDLPKHHFVGAMLLAVTYANSSGMRELKCSTF